MTQNIESRVEFNQLVRMDGRGIVVLGTGGGGIGTEVTKLLADGGAKLLCVDIVEDEAKRMAAEVGGEPYVADVTNREQVKRLFEHAESRFGDGFYGFVDIIGAGIQGPLEEFDDAAIEKMLTLNLRHAIYAAQSAGPMLAKRKRGAMVFISSLAGEFVSPGQPLYGVAKAGLNHFMHYCADEFGPSGVRANAIGTGLIAYPKMLGNVASEAIKTVVEGIPLRRVGKPSDIAGAVYFLMSDLAAYVTGTVLHVEGGFMVGSRGIPRSMTVNDS